MAEATSKASPLHFRNSGCYAAALWGCSAKLSGEHGISAAVLKVLTSGKRKVGITNHPWQRPGLQAVRISSLKAKVLCTRHNESLSGLDHQMKLLMRALSEIGTVLTTGDEDIHAVHNFYGPDLERWLLKAFCAAMRSGQFSGYGGAAWAPPISWLRFLFERKQLPPSLGLYVATDTAENGTVMQRSFYFSPLTARLNGLSVEKFVVGCRFSAFALRLILFLGDPRSVPRGEPQWLAA